MTDEELRAGFAQDLVFLRYAGLRPVVVHGGGPQVTELLERLGIESTFTAGLRVTTPETIDVVRMVLAGKVNKDIVGLINRYRPFAVGLSGEDANLFTAERKLAIVNGEPVDIGLVGEITRTDPGAIEALIDDGRIPVVSSVARGENGETLQRQRRHRRRRARGRAQGGEARRADRRGRPVPGLARLDRGDQRAHGRRTGRAAAGPDGRDDPQDGGLPHGGARRRPAGARPGRPPQARCPAGDLHRLRHRHHGDGRPQVSKTEALQKRFEAALMPNYGVPPVAIAVGRAAGSGTPTARSTWT